MEDAKALRGLSLHIDNQNFREGRNLSKEGGEIMRKLWPYLAIAVILGFTTQAFSQPARRPCFREGYRKRKAQPMPRRFERGRQAFGFFLGLREKLGLTDEQIDKLKSIKLEHEKAAIKTESELKLKRLELRELMQAEEPDESAVKVKIEEIGELKTQLAMNKIDGGLEARKVLTEKQLKKLKELRKHPPKLLEEIKKKHK